MKYESYAEYVKAATEYFSKKEELTIPVEYMLLSEDMFNLFKGDIKFGQTNPNAPQKTGCCGQCDGTCDKEDKETKE